MDSMANHIANLGTDMLTNPTVVQLHEKCMDSTPTHITNLGTDMLTNPTSCSIVPKMHGFYGDSHCKPWRRHACKPYQLFNCTKDAWILQQYCKPWHRQCMDSMAIPMANLGTDMLTNPTAVLLHVKTI